MPSSRRSATISRVRRVLPTPAGPTRVTSRSPATSCVSSASSRWRPTSGDQVGLGPRAGPRRHAAPASRSRSGLERGEGRGRVEAGLVGQPAPQVVRDAQGLGRTSVGGQHASQHQLGPLTERVGGARHRRRRRAARGRLRPPVAPRADGPAGRARSTSSAMASAASGATSANSSRAVPRQCARASRSSSTASPADVLAGCGPRAGAPRPRRARHRRQTRR